MLGWMLAFPLIGFLVCSIFCSISGGFFDVVFGKKFSARKTGKMAGAFASAAIFSSFVVAVMQFLTLNDLEESQRVIEQTIFQWITISGVFSLPFKLVIDPLACVMTLVITGVGTLIHVYSIGYIDRDETPVKFFAYLNLFCFAMLVLVLGGNFPVLFLGWEGVGLCSYLLIGYWYTDPAKASAGKKAFIVNRIGDLGFLIGIFILYGMFDTMDFQGLKDAILTGQISNDLNVPLLTAATLCLFVGAMGKSAQIPLSVWLPDAMAGPTPVSALIHAATMVTAGVYMIVRLNFMFSLCPSTQMVISGIGAGTALFAATIALVQKDIKKVLAYSTISQLGFMFMAVGVGATVAGIFHLVTHAFFKALLFLGAGSVIHGMHEEQDITKMGGLKKYMPYTFWTFLIGTMAIAGIPPFAGFFSKDEILWAAFSGHSGLAGPALYVVGMFTALLTAFYMTRLTCLTFLGLPRFDSQDVKKIPHPHESPFIMTGPLMLLAVFSALGGFIGFPGHSWLADWLAPVTGMPGSGEHDKLEFILMGVSVTVACIGVGTGFTMYVKSPQTPKKLKASFEPVYKVLFNKYYLDELYEAVFIRPVAQFSRFCWKVIDVILVDGFVLAFGKFSKTAGEIARQAQTGSIQVYAVFILMGLIATLGYVIYGLGH